MVGVLMIGFVDVVVLVDFDDVFVVKLDGVIMFD